MDTTIVYTKVTGDNPEVKLLVASSGLSVKEVCGFINQNRYRQAYNKRNNERMKVVRKLVKEHPELLKGGE